MLRKLFTIVMGFILICSMAIMADIREGPTNDSPPQKMEQTTATFTVTNTNDSGPGSLRDAINAANANLGKDTIIFAIPGAGVQTIFPLSQLPPLMDMSGVLIDGLSQPGASAGITPPTFNLLIEIDGANAGVSHGIWIQSSNNTIRGLIINNFEQNGIYIQGGPDQEACYNYISQNIIGADSSGTIAKGNGRNQSSLWAGVYIGNQPGPQGYACDNTIEINLISANYAEGVSIVGPIIPGDVWRNFVVDNYIGTDINGNSDLGNMHEGVCLCEGTHENVVGGNLISGNDYDGIGIQGYYYEPPIQTYLNIIQDNTIGLTVNGTALGNSYHGIAIGEYGPSQWGYADSNQIGPNNIIAYNGHDGVSVWEHGASANNADNNLIFQNSIYDNTELGIDLQNDGVTANDLGDPDTGPNQEVNFPVITNITYVSGTGATISGTLDIDTSPNQAKIEVFLAAIDPTGYGEGKTYLGSTTPDGVGNWSITIASVNPGDYITATTTDLNNNTSEFCANVQVPGGPSADTCEFYKSPYTDYAPQGMPDFDQKQDAWNDPQGWTHCGPVAVANCLWWFDSKFEPNPLDPRPFGVTTPNDGYNLITAYGQWDDHDTNNVQPLVNNLANLMGTNLAGRGTNLQNLVNGTQQFIANAGLSQDYKDSLQLSPTFDFIKEQVLDSQDVILLLGFYEDLGGYVCRIGGHYITAAGACTTATRICVSDPYYDMLEGNPPGAPPHGSTVHNDANNISGPHGQIQHDPYDVFMGPLPGGATTMALLPGYQISPYDINIFEGENSLNGVNQCPYQGGPIITAIDAAYVICPVQAEPDTCEYHKKSYDDYSPDGMPDFDQKQNQWISPFNGNWSWCGPVALANCMWWFDSKFEPNPVDPRPFYPNPLAPPKNDGFSLVQSYDPNGLWDDHDTNNVIPFINQLGPLCNTDVVAPGTNILDLENGFKQWLSMTGLDGKFSTYVVYGPPYEEIRDSVLSSQDVIILLGFYELIDGGECQRLGGHYVTAAGVCTTSTSICISDPYFDKNEGEPPAGSAHGSSIHNDAYNISGPHGTINHDLYNMIPNVYSCPSPATWALADYPSQWQDIMNFENLNSLDPAAPPVTYFGGPIVVLVDAALIICPLDTCSNQTPGDANSDGIIDINDVNYLINFVDSGGPAPVPLANGDANGDCRINVGDIVCLSDYLSGSGSCLVNCTCLQPDTTICCYGMRGNVDYDPYDKVNANDILYLIAYAFQGGPAPSCFEEADVNGDNTINANDILYLISYAFSGGPAPVSCP
ncbi:MAG: hypothetical protein GXO93_05190 [FCB group bacterium]|nr:hypothetical protein [FCB group bacterium]